VIGVHSTGPALEQSRGREFVEPLAWDSQHFGFMVARVHGPSLGAVELDQSLSLARRDGVRLLYWAADANRDVSPQVLAAYHGVLVDRKATYSRPLARGDRRVDPSPCCAITTHRRAEPSAELNALALAAGEFSRFRRDPRIPAAAFRSLYQTWLLRSATGELADIVLIASAGDRAGASAAPLAPLGFVTVSLSEGKGSIGLIAVAERARGRGIGSSLLKAAHCWLARHTATDVFVVTQLENQKACRLYERSGYRLLQVQHVYHFWP
jgi:dTDP-4-amino-4,6-dideoxy-D-galactose acyltransferase